MNQLWCSPQVLGKVWMMCTASQVTAVCFRDSASPCPSLLTCSLKFIEQTISHEVRLPSQTRTTSLIDEPAVTRLGIRLPLSKSGH